MKSARSSSGSATPLTCITLPNSNWFQASHGATHALDTRPALREAERRGAGPLYRALGNMHLTDSGQSVVAEAIAAGLAPIRQ